MSCSNDVYSVPVLTFSVGILACTSEGAMSLSFLILRKFEPTMGRSGDGLEIFLILRVNQPIFTGIGERAIFYQHLY